ncbi:MULTISPECIES: DUF1499 domain-containing protein [unclassified Leptolyngbya]|uniref:DUF1499 domain-containing protein n=1 Tax=unclassified Leptolyngbya TaxID=2650499 RepID=UPI001AC9DABE|nr:MULTISPECIES: DUF1499 domain-containing protein [unclassified Leptolyngbya]MBN8558947.1 DUF1499 domain-containing protein [Leptolyngbya sp. UWPOB_LEPTO1]MCY6488940.1 DUF1499 domain-containing protein [Leptolyngbya sp. GGD]
MRRTFTLILLLSFCWLTSISPAQASLFSFSGSRPTNLGLHNDRLTECPSTPNCVNSVSSDSTHAIAPLKSSNIEKAFADLKQVIESQPRTKIIESTENYLYAEFTSKLMGFVDDVEFYLDKTSKAIQVRSASRLGESDLGVNRQRIESIRTQLSENVT